MPVFIAAKNLKIGEHLNPTDQMNAEEYTVVQSVKKNFLIGRVSVGTGRYACFHYD